MARFRYSMQSILNIKLKMETLAKQEFSAARAALDAEEERLQQLFDRKSGYEKKAKALLSGVLNVRDIEENKAAIRCMEDYIVQQRMRVEAAERALEEARERLTTVMMERKTHETLKEKAFQVFLMEEKRQESKEIDQLTSYTYGQRLMEGKHSMEGQHSMEGKHSMEERHSIEERHSMEERYFGIENRNNVVTV